MVPQFSETPISHPERTSGGLIVELVPHSLRSSCAWTLHVVSVPLHPIRWEFPKLGVPYFGGPYN